MSEIYFTGCTHAFHKNICKGITTWKSGALRDFNSEIKMTEELSNRINSKVKENDIIYCLGDWSFNGQDKIKIFRDMINCKNVHLILGNHCQNIRNNINNCQRLFSSVQEYTEKTFNKTLFTMFHYPIGSWNGIHRGSFNLHSHTHGQYNRTYGKQLDVGVDTNSLYPYSLDEIFQIMNKKEFKY